MATKYLFFDEVGVHIGNVMTLSSPSGTEMAILSCKVTDGILFKNISNNSSLIDVVLQMFHMMWASLAPLVKRNYRRPKKKKKYETFAG